MGKVTISDAVVKKECELVVMTIGLLLDAIEGQIKGSRGLVRRRIQILDDLKEKRSYGNIKDAVEDQ